MLGTTSTRMSHWRRLLILRICRRRSLNGRENQGNQSACMTENMPVSQKKGVVYAGKRITRNRSIFVHTAEKSCISQTNLDALPLFNKPTMNNTNTCSCGSEKPPQFETCYGCKKEAMKTTHDKCPECGKPKQKKYGLCFQCSHN
jgi:hypothetical protein